MDMNMESETPMETETPIETETGMDMETLTCQMTSFKYYIYHHHFRFDENTSVNIVKENSDGEKKDLGYFKVTQGTVIGIDNVFADCRQNKPLSIGDLILSEGTGSDKYHIIVKKGTLYSKLVTNYYDH